MMMMMHDYNIDNDDDDDWSFFTVILLQFEWWWLDFRILIGTDVIPGPANKDKETQLRQLGQISAQTRQLFPS